MEDELRRFVSQRLPEYMIPSSFVILDNLPLTVTGKVDRKKLPLEMLEDLGDSSYQAPSSATEETISRFFAELLGKKKIGVNDNFFELGGHSLMAMRLILRLGEEFDLDIPLRIFLENPNVAALAAIIDSSTGLFKKPDMLPSDFEEGEI
jgi:acyl carrier protein